MRKIAIALTLAVAGAFAVAAPSAQAQDYPQVANLTAFSPECNYMSKPGYLRYRYALQGGEFITYERAAQIVAAQGG